ncbi:unnamed protein product [Toxocara canis]|uniref:Acyl-CoA_dh_1 domain-containing protein n=1 Tax=Toxocara canis TaxID=6265 RepID=A0A183U8L6_TOXCA|nr:unnamed protein product [Toxocara canis]VDM33133.1 unnamed protein product [Toxocara canis]
MVKTSTMPELASSRNLQHLRVLPKSPFYPGIDSSCRFGGPQGFETRAMVEDARIAGASTAHTAIEGIRSGCSR